MLGKYNKLRGLDRKEGLGFVIAYCTGIAAVEPDGCEDCSCVLGKLGCWDGKEAPPGLGFVIVY